MLFDLLRADGSIVVNKRLAKELGLHEAIVLSEVISRYKYHEERQELTEDGWFYLTVEKLQDNTTLSKSQQANAVKTLVGKGLIESEKRGMPSKRYFKINEDAITTFILDYKKLKKLTTGSEKNELQEVKKVNTNNTYNNTDLINSVSKYVEEGVPPISSEIYKSYRQNFKHSTYAKNTISDLCAEHTPELVELAVQRAITGEPDKPILFIKGILRNWSEAGCKTVEDVLRHEETFRQQKQAEKDKKQQGQNKAVSKGNKRITRKEQLPEWLEEQKQQSQEPQIEVIDLEEERRLLEEELKQYQKA